MKVLDYFFLLRPTLFFSLMTIYLLGVYSLLENGQPISISIQYVLSIIIFQAIIYLYNQINDKETDKINKKLFYLADEIISEKGSIIYYHILFAMFFILLMFTNYIFISVMLIATLLLNFLYSHPSYNWKGKPLFSCLSALLGGMLMFLAGYFTAPQDDWIKGIIFSIPSGLAVLTAAIIGMQIDCKGDSCVGKNTVAVYLGYEKTKYLILAITVTGIVFSLFLSQLFFVSSFLICLLFQIILPLRLDLQVKSPILLLSLFAGWCFPVYYLYIIGYYILARWYYKKRFNLKYP